ncbi:class I SAM-dependent methyltransferase [Paracidobacterium acidisoli]|uniref:S-adenosyl-L-methionine-dependent methyltransferase n=1 Tax=Paracidobacterium acidisoli TaxID=2303751 RepID=A0A372IME8_9BACT|nr:class I SAM-dependent methyltransferase [Paracidobacterium acidisoli]MBT9332536.1 class I SAM-dependent methyltransferase [Paracidobacterium acidisoli]
MQQGRASRTALRVAMRRAAHQLYDEPLVFHDPLALRVLGEEDAARVLSETEAERNTPWVRGMRAFMAVRSRFAEDELATAMLRGARQYVVLGAGLDTFACRNPHEDLMVFEVDHPATQAWKRCMIDAAGFQISHSVRFAPVDFERETLAEGLAAAGFCADKPAFFSWLGVIPYLTEAAAMATLACIAGLPQGSGVAFDYAMPRESLGATEQSTFDALAARVAAAGEPFRLFLTPEDMELSLRTAGFSAIEDLNSVAINERYFAERKDGLRIRGTMGHLVSAWV